MFSIFCRVDGVPGESTDKNHKDWIEVISFQHGIQHPVSVGGGGGGAGGPSARSQHQDFAIVKHLDKASPKLYESVCTGKFIKKVTIEMLRAGGDRVKFMEIDLEEVIVSGVATTGAALGMDSLPTESVSFTYSKIRWIYTQIRPDGTSGGTVKSGWDIAANRPA